MHIPDNYLSPSTCVVMGAAMLPILSVATKKVKVELTDDKMPLLGIGAAFSFLLMLFNIPLPGGTTGHAVGGTLLAILMGPYAACISITVALLLQALLFGDGGILALGANCFNMAFVMPFVGYSIYKMMKDNVRTARGEYLGIAIGSYFGMNIAALFAAVEFGLQPLLFRNEAGLPLYCPYPIAVSVPGMMIPHILVVGVVEAVFTLVIFAYIKKVSPGTIYDGKIRTRTIYLMIFALICFSPLGILASGTAWGEWGPDEIRNIIADGEILGYVPGGMMNGFSFDAPLPDYTFSTLPDTAAYILSALAGVAILIILFKIVGCIKNKRAEKTIE